MFCLLLAVKAYGIKGAAIVCAGRFLMEAVFLFTLAHRLLPHKAGFLPKLSVAAAVAFLSLLVTAFPQSLAVRIGLVVLILLVFALLVGLWFWNRKNGPSFSVQTKSRVKVRGLIILN